MALWYYSLREAESSSVEAQLEEEYLGLSKRGSQWNTWLFLWLSRYSYVLKTSDFRSEPQEPYERRRDFLSKRILTDFKKVIWQQIRIYAEILACVSYVRKNQMNVTLQDGIVFFVRLNAWFQLIRTWFFGKFIFAMWICQSKCPKIQFIIRLVWQTCIYLDNWSFFPFEQMIRSGWIAWEVVLSVRQFLLSSANRCPVSSFREDFAGWKQLCVFFDELLGICAVVTYFVIHLLYRQLT